jgi:hypothetical protein
MDVKGFLRDEKAIRSFWLGMSTEQKIKLVFVNLFGLFESE